MSNLLPSYFVFSQKNIDSIHALPLSVREMWYNAKKHGATYMIIGVLEDPLIGDGVYFLVATDADAFLNNSEIIKALKLAEGSTGIQGSGILAAGILSSGTPFDHNNNEAIIYSNGFCFSSAAIPKDLNTNNYENLIKDRKDLIPVIQSMINKFKFANGNQITVLHLFKLRSYGDEGLVKARSFINKKSLCSIREFCPEFDLSLKACIRHTQMINSKENNLYTVFVEDKSKVDQDGREVKDHEHNRISSGLSPLIYEQMYSWRNFAENDIKIDAEITRNRIKFRIKCTADLRFVFFPGLHGKNGQVTLRNVGQRKSGSQSGHDIEDSGNRIFLITEGGSSRPFSDPVYVMNDVSPYRPSVFSQEHLGILTKTRPEVSYNDVANFLDTIRGLDALEFIDYERLVSMDKEGNIYRCPYLKIYCKIRDSEVIGIDTDYKKTITQELNLGPSFYADNSQLSEKIIEEAFTAFRQNESFKKFKEYYDILFPRSFGNEEKFTLPANLLDEESKLSAKRLNKVVVRIPDPPSREKIVTKRKKK